MDEINERYFRRRAEQELDLVQRASDPAVVSAHRQMAQSYLDRVGGDPKVVIQADCKGSS